MRGPSSGTPARVTPAVSSSARLAALIASGGTDSAVVSVMKRTTPSVAFIVDLPWRYRRTARR